MSSVRHFTASNLFKAQIQTHTPYKSRKNLVNVNIVKKATDKGTIPIRGMLRQNNVISLEEEEEAEDQKPTGTPQQAASFRTSYYDGVI